MSAASAISERIRAAPPPPGGGGARFAVVGRKLA